MAAMNPATSPDDIRDLFERQRAATRAQPDVPLHLRRERLLRLGKLLEENAPVLAAAVQADFGIRSPRLTEVADFFVLRAQLQHTLRHLARWSRPQKVRTPSRCSPRVPGSSASRWVSWASFHRGTIPCSWPWRRP